MQMKRRFGIAIVYITVVFGVMIALASLAVDAGRVALVRTELLRAADAAARYACTGIADGTYTARAIAAAGDNEADGAKVALTAADVVPGSYNPDTHRFTANANPANAVQVTCTRKGDQGVRLLFAELLGIGHFDLKATSIAYAVPRAVGFTGLDGINVRNNVFVGSYDSTVTTNPSQFRADGKAGMNSNGNISAGSNTSISGNLLLGPAGSSSGLNLVDGGQIIHRLARLIPPEMPDWSPGLNPGGVPRSLTLTSDTVLQGGKYWFTYLSVQCNNLTFSGPAILYVDGDIDLQGKVTAFRSVPSNLKIFQIGHHKFGNSGYNDLFLCAVVVAPDSEFATKNNATIYGSAVFKRIDLNNNADFYYDEATALNGGSAAGIDIALVR